MFEPPLPNGGGRRMAKQPHGAVVVAVLVFTFPPKLIDMHLFVLFEISARNFWLPPARQRRALCGRLAR